MAKINKKTFQVTLTESNIDKAKALQVKLAKAENLSGLIDGLIEDWIVTAEQLLVYHEDFDKKIKKNKMKEESKT